MQIRPLSPTDIAAAARLLRVLAERSIVHDCAPDDAAAFLREHDADGIARHVAAGMVYHVALVNAQLVGLIGMRERRHVFHLFVDQAHQRQGVARALWQQAWAAAGQPAVVTVNASVGAVPVCLAFGFTPTAPLQSRNGITFHPMQFEGNVHA